MNSPSFFGIDDVSVQRVTPPLLQSVARNGNAISFTRSAVSGQNFQVQHKTNLNQSTWMNLGNQVTATGTTATFSHNLTTDTQRFYRIILLLP